jgi:hypothetical protein
MGGSSKTTSASTVPAWVSQAQQDALARAQSASHIGNVGYYGPDVAAMTPSQTAAMQGTNMAASAFGQPTVDVTAGMPTATNYGGMNAYSSGAGYDAALAELKARFPGQFDAIMAQFVNPVTGAMPAGYSQTQMGMPVQAPASPIQDRSSGGYTGGNDSSSAKISGTGYTSFRDMFDGGGQGRSGSTFSGGLLSGKANKAGFSPMKSSQKSTVTRQSGR